MNESLFTDFSLAYTEGGGIFSRPSFCPSGCELRAAVFRNGNPGRAEPGKTMDRCSSELTCTVKEVDCESYFGTAHAMRSDLSRAMTTFDS